MQSFALARAFDEYELPHVKPTGSELFFVYHYDIDGYDGTGVGLVVHDDGRLSWWDMSHCSCYGPIEPNTWPGAFVTRQEWDRLVAEKTRGYDPESIMSKYEEPWVLVDKKLKELMG